MSSLDKTKQEAAPTEAPTYWRSFKELENSPEFLDMLKNEFPEHEEELKDPLGRRRFMQLMGASMAFAGVGGLGGCRWEEEKIVPLSRRPEGYVPGKPQHYATAMELGGVAAGLVVTAYEGRPTKIEGNPQHPDSGRATTSFAQASILELYDPDRSQSLTRQANGQALPATWDDFDTWAKTTMARAGSANGNGFHILSEATSSPTIHALRRELLSKLPQAQWTEYEPLSRDNEREGTRLVFGQPHRVQLNLAPARVIVALDADLLGDHPAALRHARDFSQARDPDGGVMNRLYAIESTFSPTGATADHRLPLRSDLVKPIALALEKLVTDSSAQPGASLLGDTVGILGEDNVIKLLGAIREDLARNRGRSVVAVGHRQPPEVHAIVARINDALNNTERTVSYSVVDDPNRPPHARGIADLARAMDQGQVDTLIMLGGNPVYNAPTELGFAAALGKVKESLHLSAYHNETSAATNWHLPRAHFLEGWGDARSWDGTYTITQPLIAPIHGGRSVVEVLQNLVGRAEEKTSDLVKQTFMTLTDNIFDGESAWRKALHDGVATDTKFPTAAVRPSAVNVTALTADQRVGTRIPNGQLEVVFTTSTSTYDGRFANSGWLQELPDFMTKVTWDNAALISPRTAKDLNISNEEIVKIKLGDRELEVAAYVMPGQAPYSIGLELGFGRTRAGHVGGSEELGVPSVGFDTYGLRTTDSFHIAGGATIKGTGKSYQLASTQDHWAIDTLGQETTQTRIGDLVKEASMATYQRDPKFTTRNAHTPDIAALTPSANQDKVALSLWDEHEYEGYRWAMATDLSKCIGCNTCVIACQAENNIPVVGKEQVLRNREMHWIRIDRYFKGDPDNPELVHQPVTCQQCELAPCEQVCPVGATIHTSEGLNDMVYNRCVGTRYCLNNCPYRVRRFNFFYYHKELDEARAKVKKLLFNPEVTVRSRGVMEKCTYCVQRIQAAKIEAKNNRRVVEDGEFTTACAQACPTEAIIFGNLNDPNSRVAKLHQVPRAYAMLAELNIKPRNSFLARIRNPHPSLAS
jgi:molybdopterin-containing oxidoreductase family iron-sulfur binding subunit